MPPPWWWGSLAYDRAHDTLYVASTGDNKIFAIADAGKSTSDGGTGFVIFADQQHLHGPLGLVLTPKGNLIIANGDAVAAGARKNDLVEFTPHGNLVATYQLDAGPAGGAFGIAITASHGGVRFAAVDDDLNTVTVWTVHSDNQDLAGFQWADRSRGHGDPGVAARQQV